jgi:hypothetical protein
VLELGPLEREIGFEEAQAGAANEAFGIVEILVGGVEFS